MKQDNFSCNPSVAWLTVNRGCNFRCPWCYGESTGFDPTDSMSIETAKELVKIAFDIGVKYFHIIGGEPTLWPHLFELNQFCKELGVTTGLITNGARFGNDDFWREYQLYPCDNMSVSIKSVDQEQFKKVTKTEMYDQAMKGIERAIGFRDTGVSTVYNSLVGLDGLRNIAIKTRDLGAKFFTLDLCTAVVEEDGISKGFSIEPHQLALDIMEIQPFLSELFDKNFEIEVFIPLCLFPKEFIEKMLKENLIGTVCHVYSRSGINFDINGDILPCNQMIGTTIAKKGIDYIDGPSLLSHLNNESLRADYQELLRYPSEACKECHWKHDCRGGCLVNWMVFDPSICQRV